MIEVERKVRADHDAVRERLSATDATRLGRQIERDTYYDHPARDFAETDEALRVRTIEPVPDEDDDTDWSADDDNERLAADRDATARTELTYKGPKVDDVDKTRRELSTGLDDPDSVDATLQALGFAPVATVTKERTAVDIEECRVTLDVVEDVGSFVEVEVQIPTDDEDAVKAARNRCSRALATLGLEDAEAVRTSYLGLLLAGEDETTI